MPFAGSPDNAHHRRTGISEETYCFRQSEGQIRVRRLQRIDPVRVQEGKGLLHHPDETAGGCQKAPGKQGTGRVYRYAPQFSGILPLGDNDLYDLFTLLRFKQYGPDEIILRKGEPGTHLYIILTGKVEVVGDKGEPISEMESGGVFGEMSLLTGAPVGTSVYSRSVTKLAALTSKDFKHVLHRYPVLHVFFYRLLIERAGKIGKRFSADIGSGMAGDIAEVHVVELFQMINASQKTGTVELKLPEGNATVMFNEGEVVSARYGNLTGKEALYKLLGVTKGQFSYQPGIPPEAEGNEVIGGFMGLVMEGMQLLDEEEGLPEGMHFPGRDSDQYF
jgi:CRP-like cAMP-binding protein